MINGFNFGYCHDERELTFSCDDEKVFKDVCDYIERYIDAERYRREPKQVTIVQKEPLKRY